jgi:hypothetical protein
MSPHGFPIGVGGRCVGQSQREEQYTRTQHLLKTTRGLAGKFSNCQKTPTSRPPGPPKKTSSHRLLVAVKNFFTFIFVCSETISCQSPVYCALFPEQTCIISSSIRKVLVIDLIEKSEGSG